MRSGTTTFIIKMYFLFTQYICSYYTHTEYSQHSAAVLCNADAVGLMRGWNSACNYYYHYDGVYVSKCEDTDCYEPRKDKLEDE